jgi:antitoxin (DNA-binding transcriptional repressor) of toxin-antitoxin stability system
MAQVHMTEAEVASDFAAVLRKVGHGEEVVVDRNGEPVALIKPAAGERDRLLSESIAIARKIEKERGYTSVPDPDFANDLEDIVRNRQIWNPTSWE